jgi:alkanesulfonate monooxygenase SsuD/methylene tetrahydromethanopterin reductase-like flavin-dependent oxidoreductase (luciferase family)
MAGRRVLFGMSVVPTAADFPQIVEQVLAAERLGLDLVGIQDHPYQRRFLDTFALIADLQARTTRLRFFPDVASLPMRGATMLAKAAASLDVLSSGRFELGIGAGNFWDAVAGMGGPRRTTAEAVDALEEAIPIIRAALDVGPERRVVRGPGPHYPVPGYPPGPPPAHRVEIWVGAYRPRGLRLIGRMADGWIPSLGHMGPEAFRETSARIDEAAVAAGRDPRAIRRLYNIGGRMTDGPRGDGPLDGPVEHWIATLTDWALDLGVNAFVYWPQHMADLERYAIEVVPAVKAALERA